MRQLFSAPFQCRIFLLIDGRHSVRRATLIGLCGTACQRRWTKQVDAFKYFNFILRALILLYVLLVCTQTARDPELCVRGILSCHLNCGQHRGAATLTPQSFCVLTGLTGKFHADSYCWCPQMLSLHANNVLHRVRGMIGFVCTLIVFATLCGHATLE
ncbi:hypothetical protein TcCL_ESM07774 [Trypanosoma cruzi]|nr:hypothetical protein TcCL_ESM07774 [Trypanosoma cruzi]